MAKGRSAKKEPVQSEESKIPPAKKTKKTSTKPIEEGNEKPLSENNKPKENSEPRKTRVKKTVEEKPAPAAEETNEPKKTRGKKTVEKKPAPAAEETNEPKKTRGKKSADKELVEEEPKAVEKRKRAPPKSREAAPPPPPKTKTESKSKKTKKTENNEDEPVEKKPKKAPADSVPLLNKTNTDWKSIDFSCNKKNADGNNYNLKITSWNVDGLRAWLKKDGLSILQHDNPDVLCLQETKCNEDDLPEEVKEVEGYNCYWCASNKSGYAGVALFSKITPINVIYGIGIEEHDDEGRCITAEFDNYYVVSVYVPNAGRKLVTLPKRLEWNIAFKKFVKELDDKKPVIICGDMNVAHNEIDLKNPKTNTKNAGFTKEEREGMTEFLGDGYVDAYRELYPDATDIYTFWSYMAKSRSKNVGWRLDYFIISKRILPKVCDTTVLSEVYGSDHCPIVLFINC